VDQFAGTYALLLSIEKGEDLVPGIAPGSFDLKPSVILADPKTIIARASLGL
jgi:hypothetical protein